MPVWARERRRGGDDSGFAPSMFAVGGGTALFAAARLGRERLRTFRVLAGARVAMAATLLLWLSLLQALRSAPHASPLAAYAVTAVYVLATLGSLLWSWRRESALAWQVLAAIVVDLLTFASLQFLAAFPNREFALIYALPVLAAGIYGTLSLTLLVAAIVSLLLLGDATLALLSGRVEVEAQLLNAGFVGAAYFAVGALTWQLSQRLAQQEARARGSELRARRQLAINQRVIEEQRDGILVVDASDAIEALNPAAQRLLQLPWGEAASARGRRGRSLRDMPTASAVVQELAALRAERQDTREAVISNAAGARLRLQLSVLPDLPGGAGYLIVLQDLRDIDARIQQEKLAAMGRLVASVAHEIRNPLGAIAQANALAGEGQGLSPQTARLHQIVAQNVERINRTVEDVLELGRLQPRETADLAVASLLRELQAEFDPQGSGRVVLRLEDEAALLRFDALHLRRVLVNLLSNALRYASARPGAIELQQLGRGRVSEIRVGNDGPVIDPELRRQLFEPFRTTSSCGLGLGLYISLELCARNGARLLYRVEHEHTPQARGHFAIVPRSVQTATAAR